MNLTNESKKHLSILIFEKKPNFVYCDRFTTIDCTKGKTENDNVF